MLKNLIVILSLTLFFAACAVKTGETGKGIESGDAMKIDLTKKVSDIDRRVAQFAPVKINTDLGFLDESERKVLSYLIKASEYIDEIYFRQVFSGNVDFKLALVNARNLNRKYLDYFGINYGPFDRLDNQKPFIGSFLRPLGANFYPQNITKEEFNKWLKKHPEDEKAFKNLTTVIKREGDKLIAVPYSKEYEKWLNPAAKYLKKAAENSNNKSFKKFLNSRAQAFLTDDYYQSDIDWMDIKGSPIEITIGPYEVYEDTLFGYKASFESFVTVINPVESKKLEVFQQYLKELDQNLPMPDKYKSKRTSYESPIRVAEVVYTAGDARQGVQTIAFNLPNDERVRMEKGNKQVMLKNLIDAKFEGILSEIAKEVLDKDQLKYLSDEAFFLEVLHHELAHSLGPGDISVSGKKTSVNTALKDKYSTIEEAKADTCSVYNILHLIDKGVVDKSVEKALLPTYLAGIFRSIRFGMAHAHGAGMIMQFNFLKEKGAIEYNNSTGKFRVNFKKVRPAFKDLANHLLVIEAKGDYEGAVTMYNKYGSPPKTVKEALAKLKKLPVDIKPVFVAFK